MRRALHCICLSGVLLCAHAAAAKTELLKTRSGSLVHWTGTKISIGLAPAAASKTIAHEGVALAVERAVETWNAVRAGQPRLHIALGTSADVTIRFCRGRWHGDTIDLGKSEFTASLRDGAVTAATVELNECDHIFTAPDEGVAGRYDLQAVMTHELGHVLGLGHSDNPAAIMHPNGRGAEVRRPHTDDKTALALIYFGRSAAESQKEISTGHEQADPHLVALRTRDENVPVSDIRLAAGAARTDHRTGNTAPADLVSVLNLTAGDGRQILLYTCEPTLLPPIGAAPSQDVKRSASRRAREQARQRIDPESR